MDVPAALISTLVNVRYLTGFTGSNAALLVGVDGRDVFVTDGRYTDQSAAQLPDVERVTGRSVVQDLVTVANEKPCRVWRWRPTRLRGRPGHRWQVVQRPHQEAG